jgi:hypothetical protein
VFGDREVHEATPIMGQDQKDKQNAEGGCRHGEEVDRGHLTEWLVRKMRQVWEGGLRWRWQILGNRGLRLFDSEFEKFCADAERAPQRVGLTHPSSQVATLSGCGWSTRRMP